MAVYGHCIEKIAGRYELSDQISPLHPVEQPFTRQTEVNLRLAIGKQPERAWKIIQTYDRHFSEDLKAIFS